MSLAELINDAEAAITKEVSRRESEQFFVCSLRVCIGFPSEETHDPHPHAHKGLTTVLCVMPFGPIPKYPARSYPDFKHSALISRALNDLYDWLVDNAHRYCYRLDGSYTYDGVVLNPIG